MPVKDSELRKEVLALFSTERLVEELKRRHYEHNSYRNEILCKINKVYEKAEKLNGTPPNKGPNCRQNAMGIPVKLLKALNEELKNGNS